MYKSQNGWPANIDPKKIGIDSFLIVGTKIKVRCAEAVAPLLVNFAIEFHEHVEPIDEGQLDDWGYAYRNVRNSPDKISNHASGTALDLNATKHPLGKSNTFTKAQCNTIKLLITKYGLAWGGTWKRKDEMHFEIALTAVQVNRKIKELGLQ